EGGDGTRGGTVEEGDVPKALAPRAHEARAAMIEALAEVDDEVMEAYLANQAPAPEVLRAALRRATIAGRAVPVLVGAAFKNKGVQPLLDAVVDYLPSPADIPAVSGQDPAGRAVTRPATDQAPFSALAFQIMNG